MPRLPTRRTLIAGAAASVALPTGPFAARIAAIERRHGGRLGVALLDSGANTLTGWRLTERFPMCSTFKLLAASLVLTRVDRGVERLDRRIVFTAADLFEYAPITRQHVGPPGMTIEDLAAAAVSVSDNTAANLLLASVGGPAAVTAFARRLADPVTRLDRTELALNEGTPGDPRDTTAPAAMARDLQSLLLGGALRPASRARLTAWLKACTTGGARLRAGVPKDWTVGDKTGSGGHNSTNDIAILWPPGRAPLLVAAYLTEGPASADEREAMLAEVGRAVAEGL